MKKLAVTGILVALGISVPVVALVGSHAKHPAALRPSLSPSAGLSSPLPRLTSTPSSSPSATPGPVTSPSVRSTASSTPVPTIRTTVQPTAPAPAYVAYFATLPPGSALPSDAQCAREIAPNAWEPRPQNTVANHTNVYLQGFRLQNSYLAPYGPRYQSRVTGNYSGTTDQIIRWAACKWGFDENTVRAQAVIESYWRQSTLGDCNAVTQPQTNGCASVGLLQVKGANIPPTHPGTWPAAWTSTAFNVDYAMAVRRLCYDGKETWLGGSYAAGDLWGCIGRWYSGGWHDPGANQYIQRVQSTLAAKTWLTF